MTAPQRQALARLRFNSAETPDDVWQTSPSHVEGLHTRAEHRIRAGILDARESRGPSPIGLALQGQKGVGKTHLLGGVRRIVQEEGGYFFLIDLTTGAAFWEDVAEAMRSELWRRTEDGDLQLAALLKRLCDKAEVPAGVAKAVLGEGPLGADDLDGFVDAVRRRLDHLVGAECSDTLRALVLYAAADSKLMTVGKDYLAGLPETNPGERQAWHLHPHPKPHRALVTEISRVLALTGPSVVAVDQLDSLVAKANTSFDEQVTDPELAGELARIADGLMQLRETTRRTLSIVACLPNTWKLLHSVATDTVADRFTETPILGALANPTLGRALVEKWLAVSYELIGFTPPHPTWPVAPSAFGESWVGYTPRQLLRRVQEHAETCLYGTIRELTSFDEEADEEVVVVVPPAPDQEPGYFAEFDRRFAELGTRADVDAALSKHTEDAVMPDLLHAALRSWITEIGNDDRSWETEPPPDGGRRLHAGLRRTLDEERDVAERWMFRAIASRHGNSVLRLVRDAKEAAGIRTGVQNRHLVLLHDGGDGWTGPKTRKEVNELAELGSPRLEISRDDVRTFFALKEMLTSQSFELLNWLVVRKPASQTNFLREVLPVPATAKGDGQETRPPPQAGQDTTSSAPRTEAGAIFLGMDGEIRIEVESLRKHAVIFAGSGTGKTVLLRRIVEECALQGVSAIVLDPNNDLARFGDAWPQQPAGWRPGDADLAAEYLANTDVVVWTPGRATGRPLTFHPLPDFAGVRDDPDEFAAAVGAAVASLVPHARVAGGTKNAVRGRAVLQETMIHYAREGGRSLNEYVDVLSDLPDGVSKLSTARKMAADLAETLRAAMVNDPLLGGAGQPADPAALLTPAPGRRARISVISFIGLPSDEQRQGFVSQLQLEVFAWIKRNPATDRPLGGLFVMDEAQTIAPSGAWTASTQSTILLASQARKYGLGLVLATQAPKGLHNQVTGNATTQFFGRLNSPAQIAAANEMARAKGSTVADISRLERGHFYVTGDTFGFRRMRAPLCLSHHPPGPLRLEEVLDRAR